MEYNINQIWQWRQLSSWTIKLGKDNFSSVFEKAVTEANQNINTMDPKASGGSNSSGSSKSTSAGLDNEDIKKTWKGVSVTPKKKKNCVKLVRKVLSQLQPSRSV